MRILFSSKRTFDALPKPDLPDPDRPIPWVVEAPLCAVEIYEAILRQQTSRMETLTVWTSPAGFVQRRGFYKGKLAARDLNAYRGYTERDVSYVLLSLAESKMLWTWLSHRDFETFDVTQLWTPFGAPGFILGWFKSGGDEQALEAYKGLLRELELPLTQPLARSLLPAGVKPIAINFKGAISLREDSREWPYDCAYGAHTGERNWIQWTDEQINGSTTTLKVSMDE